MQILEGRNLSGYSTFQIGGPARFIAEATTVEEIIELVSWARKKGLPILLVGRGSNSLFPDHGFPGLVIINKLDFIDIKENTAHVGAGASFAYLGTKTARSGLAGLEFASGIPASVGGAIFMNAGANGQETAGCLTRVEWLDEEGKLREGKPEGFAYRKSPFQGSQNIILSATFVLTPDEEARRRQINIIKKRQATQPLTEPSIGCIFRNPEGCISAAAMIEQSGLKGFAQGGAQVSSIHANFMINRGGAKAADVEALIEVVKERVHQQFQVELEEEIRRH